MDTILKIATDLGVLVTALLAIDNVLDGMFKYFGWTAWDTQAANFANWLKKIQGNLPKTGAIVIFALIFFATFNVQAQTTTTTTVTPPSITSIMDGITADIGVGWDIRNKTWVQTDTVRFLEYANTSNTGKYAAFLNFVGNVDPRISVGYSTANKLVVGGAFNLFVPSQWGITSPLLKSVGISPFAEYEFASMGNVTSQEKDSWIFGAYLVKGSM